MTRGAQALALLTIGVSGLGGCSADYPSLYIQQNQVPDTGCVVSTSASTFTSAGILDVSTEPGGGVNLGYVFTPLIINAIAANSQQPTLHLAFLTSADIEILPGGSARSQELVAALAAAGLAKRIERISGTIKPAGTVAMSFYLTDAEMTSALRLLVTTNEVVQTVARVTVSAVVDGRTVTSYPFDYPLSFCLGCLLQDVGACAALPQTFVASTGGVCNPLQDTVLQCCDNFAVCPAMAPPMQ
jgi:hypothetical protein